jgi:transposase
MKRQRNQPIILLSEEQREELKRLMRKHYVTALYLKRAKLILALDEGKSISETARLIDTKRRYIYKWAYRYNNLGPSGLNDLKRPGRPKSKPLETIETVSQHCLISD